MEEEKKFNDEKMAKTKSAQTEQLPFKSWTPKQVETFLKTKTTLESSEIDILVKDLVNGDTLLDLEPKMIVDMGFSQKSADYLVDMVKKENVRVENLLVESHGSKEGRFEPSTVFPDSFFQGIKSFEDEINNKEICRDFGEYIRDDNDEI